MEDETTLNAGDTLSNFVARQNQLAREAQELFPYEFSECSFAQGYVRQEVYVCLTCSPVDGVNRGGLCYSCSIACHGDHNIIELMHKRAFRCDCGSARAGSTACTLTKLPRALNDKNNYNDNFENIFCYCKSKYSPESEEGTMYQCITCEDWFHDRCISVEGPLPDEAMFEDYMCRLCVAKYPWIERYLSISEAFATTQRQVDAADTDEAGVGKMSAAKRPFSDVDTSDMTLDTEPKSKKQHGKIDQDSALQHDCKWAALIEIPVSQARSMFLKENFRDYLCHCSQCLQRMEETPALVEAEQIYEPPRDPDILNSDEDSLYDAGTRALEETLRTMPREKAIEGIMAFKELKNSITEYLRPIAESGDVITADHIRHFFSDKSG